MVDSKTTTGGSASPEGMGRYPWGPWHFGFTDGPAPCSEAGDTIGMPAGGGEAEPTGGLPSLVPSRFRDPILRAAARWNVSAGLLAAQLVAESNFNPFAVSPAGTQGIAQFMPGTAALYGLDDPFDAPAAIDAEARLMSDLLVACERLGQRDPTNPRAAAIVGAAFSCLIAAKTTRVVSNQAPPFGDLLDEAMGALKPA